MFSSRITAFGRIHIASVTPKANLNRSHQLWKNWLSTRSPVSSQKPPIYPSEDSDLFPQAVYHWQEGVEELEGYCPGGFYPTHLGDRYCNGRYEIIHKLEFGSYSTVWLARDHPANDLVAIKIMVASEFDSSKESKILRALTKNSNHPGREYVSTFLNEFTITGPNGRHQCIVAEAAVCNIARAKKASHVWKFPVNAARAVSAQAILGLDYIHSCNITHGDLHLHNILLRIPGFWRCTLNDIYFQPGAPRKLPIKRQDGRSTGPEAPKYCVPPVYVYQPSDKITDPRIVLSDFGEAFFENEAPRELHTPTLLTPPESIFREPLHRSVDVWTLGCTLYDLLGERPLFEGFMPDEDLAVAEMISTLGNLPKRWWDRWEKRSDFFLEDGPWKTDTHRIHAAWSRPMSERLRIMGRGEDPQTCEFTKNEMACIEILLRVMMAYEPSTRITATDAARSEWMQRWGLPEISQTQPAP